MFISISNPCIMTIENCDGELRMVVSSLLVETWLLYRLFLNLDCWLIVADIDVIFFHLLPVLGVLDL